MDLKSGKEKAKKYYDQEASEYIQMYKDGYTKYPANLIRLKFIVERLTKENVHTILDVGCGTCGPMIRLLNETFDVRGCDFSKEMIAEGKKELEKAGFNSDLISIADLEDDRSLPDGTFDAIIALGVFPHIINEKKALSNLRKRLNKGGRVLIEFRNDLFAAFTLNKYSLDFFLNRVIDLSSLPENVRNDVIEFYSERLKTDKPKITDTGKISYQDILAKFHNPLNIREEIFQPEGFSVEKIHFYHYHALPPVFENKYPDLFRELSLEIEITDDWKGYLMASAYVVEAIRHE